MIPVNTLLAKDARSLEHAITIWTLRLMIAAANILVAQDAPILKRVITILALPLKTVRALLTATLARAIWTTMASLPLQMF
jgi:hypothetical protein